MIEKYELNYDLFKNHPKNYGILQGLSFVKYTVYRRTQMEFFCYSEAPVPRTPFSVVKLYEDDKFYVTDGIACANYIIAKFDKFEEAVFYMRMVE